jgi:hypothetical protein
MTRRRKLEATTLLNEAKKLDKQNMLKEQIVMMKEQMKKNQRTSNRLIINHLRL